MPNHEEHCRHSERRYGVRGDDIHSWMDEPSYIVGKSHRDFRHNPYRDSPTVIRIFGEEYGENIAREIFLDHIYLDNQERDRSKAQSFRHEYDEPSDPIPNDSGYVPRYSSASSDKGERIIWIIFGLICIWVIFIIYNNISGNSIGIWWNQNWYYVIGSAILIMILTTCGAIKSKTFRNILSFIGGLIFH